MLDPSPGSPITEPPSEDLSRILSAQRDRVQEFVGAHRRRLSEVEAELAGHVAQVGQELLRDRRSLSSAQAELTAACERLAAEKAQLKAQQETAETERTRLRDEARAIENQRRELAHDAAELARQRAHVQSRLAEIEHEREELDQLRADTRGQRRRIAQELRTGRDSQRADLERGRADLEQERLRLGEAFQPSAELAALRVGQADMERLLAARLAEIEKVQERADELILQRDELQRSLEHRSQELRELTAWRDQAIPLVEDRESLSIRLESAKNELEQVRRELSQVHAGLPDRAREVDAARARTIQIEEQLAHREAQIQALEQRLEAQAAAPRDTDDLEGSPELADMQRRYELSLEDIRDLKRQNDELVRKAAAGAARGGLRSSDGAQDWESQKRRMLAALESSEGDESDSERSERLKIRDVIRQTDAALARKDEEIAELKKLLDSQSSNLGTVAVGAQAFEQLLSQDEIVNSERQRLIQLRTEWEDKLRQAEVDLAVERAKNARDRAEVEERKRQFAQEIATRAEAGGPAMPGSTPKKPARGRWLTLLGLKDPEDE